MPGILFGVFHLLFYSILRITNLVQDIVPFLQMWKMTIDFFNVSEKMNGGVPRIQLNELQTQN